MQIAIAEFARFILAIAFVTANIAACSSFQTDATTSTATVISELKIGDTVEVVTVDARKLRFTIEAIEADALVGKEVRVPKSDIRIVSVKQFDAGKTAVAGVGSVAVIVGVLLIAAIAVLTP